MAISNCLSSLEVNPALHPTKPLFVGFRVTVSKSPYAEARCALKLAHPKLQRVSHALPPRVREPEPLTICHYSHFVRHHRLAPLPYHAVQLFISRSVLVKDLRFSKFLMAFHYLLSYFFNQKKKEYKCNNFVLYLNV